MLTGLYIVAIAIFLILALIAAITGYSFVFWKNLAVAAFLVTATFLYLRSQATPRFALLLIAVVEIDCMVMTLGVKSNHFITLYPFFIIFGFFFFFRLKAAVWMSLAHFLYWLAVMAYGYVHFPGHPTFHLLSLMNLTVGSVAAFIFGLFYYLSTEVTYEELERANREKEILLKEIHHRIRNNLNKISSMIGLQILSLQKGKESGSAEDALTKSRLRIEAMAMAHEALYRTKRIDRVNFRNYIENLSEQISRIYGRSIPLKIESDAISFSLDETLKLGIIVNELLTNTMKYAFMDDGKPPSITIQIERKNSNCAMTYRQKGGVAVHSGAFEKSNSLGMKLVRLTIKEMGGKMQITDEEGLMFYFFFRCNHGS